MDVPNFRSGSTRNPVTYSDAGQSKLLSLDIEALDFKPMPALRREPVESAKMGLTIAEAKEGLPIYFRVPVENVQGG